MRYFIALMMINNKKYDAIVSKNSIAEVVRMLAVKYKDVMLSNESLRASYSADLQDAIDAAAMSADEEFFCRWWISQRPGAVLVFFNIDL